MHRALAILPFALIPAALFALFFHVAILDPSHIGWLIRGSDNGENALGLHAYLHDATAAWSLRTSLLNAPEGVPLLFTDSNPLIGLVTRPFSPLLPRDAQFVGPWFLLCLVLQAAFAAALLRRHAPDRLALWAGTVLLCLLPTLFNRIIHANLFAHWLILAALWLHLEPRQGHARWWLPLLAVTALVHSYLLVMIGALWACATASRIAGTHGPPRRSAISGAAAALVLVAALAWWLGAGGRYALAGNYGAFAMPLDALVNPGNPSFSTLLPATLQREGRGFEGFQYLGAGLLALLLIAAVVAVVRPRPAAERIMHRRLLWLVPAFAALTLLAISNYPDIAGHRLPRIALPAILAPALDMVRASGRLFWPVAYALVLLAVVAAYRLGRDRAGLVLMALIALQIADLSGMATALRTLTHGGDTTFVRTRDPRWGAALAHARDVAVLPAEPTHDLQLFQEVAWRATSAAKPVRAVYAARTPRVTQVRAAADLAGFRAGRLRCGRLYLLLDAEPAPPGAAVTTLDGARIIWPRACRRPSSPRSAS
ncbi:DUF6311 domain-containing protein [Sphingomonas beigongshangi]|uniref:DUF6311 domain-containing protein n=1 Tax=Sphingomonas beigongshangi TaxID=2782540 RepID=UPI001AEE2F54